MLDYMSTYQVPSDRLEVRNKEKEAKIKGKQFSSLIWNKIVDQ